MPPLALATSYTGDIAAARVAGLGEMRGYVEQQIVPALRLPARFELTAATSGSKSLVYFLDAAGSPSMVIRADCHARLLRRRGRNHQFLERRGFACPRIVYSDFGRLTRRRFGCSIIVESKLPGATLENCDSAAAAESVGRLFARLHAITGASGGPCACRWRRPINVTRRLKRRAAKWLDLHRRMKLPGNGAIARWLAELRDEAWRHRPRLCHQDVSANNVFVDSSRIGLIDLAELGYDSAGFELGRLRVKLFLQNNPAWRACREAYMETADEGLREEISSAGAAGLGLACLHFAVFTPYAAAQRESLDELQRVIDAGTG